MNLALVTGGLLYSPNSDKMSLRVSATMYRSQELLVSLLKSTQPSPVKWPLLLFYPHLTAGQTEVLRVTCPRTHTTSK